MATRKIFSDDPTLLDKIEAGLLTRKEFEAEVVNQVYAGLQKYCEIPNGYQHCELATRTQALDSLDDEALRALLKSPPAEIINPHRSQIKVVELFHMLTSGATAVCEAGDPLSPTIGAYLYGPPGSGKTHLMAAYGRQVKKLLDSELEHVKQMMGDIVESAFSRYIERTATETETSDETTGYFDASDYDEQGGIDKRGGFSPTEEFWVTLRDFQDRVKSYPYQPTDLIYIGFKELIEVCKYSSERQVAMHALENARIVFIDDVHPQGDPEQIQIVLHLLERRYELGRGGTFLTTNLDTRELGGGDEMLANRLISRCAETLVTIDFSDCEDWRREVKSKRVKLIEDELDRRIASHQHLNTDDES